MINYTDRLDIAMRKAASAHEKQKHHRKGSDVPYIIHPFGVMVIASNATKDEDVLIACLMHDILEDVNADIYNEANMRKDFGDRVVAIVKDVTKDKTEPDWRKRSEAYLYHLEHKASDDAIIVSAADKIHNLLSILIDHTTHGDDLWDRFSTKSSADQLWWYESILEVIKKRRAPKLLIDQLTSQVGTLRSRLSMHKKINLNDINISFGGSSHPHDDYLSELLNKAYKGEIDCYRARVPLKIIEPFSDFKPATSKNYQDYFTKQLLNNSPPELLVYERDGKFVMSDDYNAYYMYKKSNETYAACTILGKPTKATDIQCGAPFKLQLPKPKL